MENRNDYFNWGKQQGGPNKVEVEDLVCKDCDYRIDGNTLQCIVYPEMKPAGVLYGKDCDNYEKRPE